MPVALARTIGRMSFVSIMHGLDWSYKEICVSDSRRNEFMVHKIYGLDWGTGLWILVSRLGTEGRPMVPESFLGGHKCRGQGPRG